MDVEGKPELITEIQAEDIVLGGWVGAGRVRGPVGVIRGEGESRDRECDAVMEGSNTRRQTQGPELMPFEDQGKDLQMRLSVKY